VVGLCQAGKYGVDHAISDHDGYSDIADDSKCGLKYVVSKAGHFVSPYLTVVASYWAYGLGLLPVHVDNQ
jgi:hypothetical protein